MALPSELMSRIRTFTPGDVLEAAEIQEMLEAAIVSDKTNFDEAALLSRALEKFSALVKLGVDAEADTKLLELKKLLSLPENEVKSTLEKPSEPISELHDLVVDMEVLSSFLLESDEHLDSIEERILSLESEFDSKIVNDIFRSIHTIKGVSGFLNLNQIKSLTHAMEYLLDDLRTQKVTINTDTIDGLLESCDALKTMIADISRQASLTGKDKGPIGLRLKDFDLASHIETLTRLREGSGKPLYKSEDSDLALNPELISRFLQEAEEALEVVERNGLIIEKTGNGGEPIHEAFRSVHTLKGNAGFFGFQELESCCMDFESFLDELRKSEKPITKDESANYLHFLDGIRLKLTATVSYVTQRIQKKTEVKESTDTKNLQAPSGDAAKMEAEGFSKYTVKKKDIRVDTEKLDSLFDLIGELITAEAMVIDNPDLKGLELENFSKAAGYLSKITRELQNITMSVRMIPLEGLFNKMQRLVRDLSHKLTKDIDLEIHGAETEMDRNIIEEISDPLVHIIRNAVDHGIETNEERKNKGKNPKGKISLDARYEGNEIWITVSDDGGGLDKNGILAKAKEKGLWDGDEVEDEEVWKLIFEPGFSTAKEVSEISGRGVGMDVVRKNIEKLRGQISINTKKDLGSQFILKIPLTLAILEGVTLKSGMMLYSLPIADVAEFQNFNPESLTETDRKHSVMRLRNEVIPVLRLSEFFTSQEETKPEREVMIVVKNQTKKMALIVDEILGYRQVVLKALPEYMGRLRCISGCTILGNGDVSLVLDINSLFKEFLV